MLETPSISLSVNTKWGHVFPFLAAMTPTLNKMRKRDPSHAISKSSAVSHEIRFWCFETDLSFLFLIALCVIPLTRASIQSPHPPHISLSPLHLTSKQPPTTPTRGCNSLCLCLFESGPEPISAPFSPFSRHDPVLQLETVCLLFLFAVTLPNRCSSEPNNSAEQADLLPDAYGPSV